MTSNIYAPTYYPAPNVYGLSSGIPLTSHQALKSIGVIDAISALDDKVQVIGGVRYQTVQVSTWDATTGLPTPGYEQNAVTPSVSLIVRPWKAISFYGNFIQALEQGPIAGAGLTNAGQVFSPFVSTQFEVGAKVDLGNFGATLSAFQITRGRARSSVRHRIRSWSTASSATRASSSPCSASPCRACVRSVASRS